MRVMTGHQPVVDDVSMPPIARMSGLSALIPRRELFDLLAQAGRVTVVSAPAGSGKTSLVRSWVAETGLSDRVAWVSVGREEHDPQAFWLSVLDSVRSTPAGSRLVRDLTAAPDLDGWMIIERLLEDLRPLEESLLLIIDDLHELRTTEAIEQLELLLRSGPGTLRFALLTRSDVRLGLHRLRLEEEVTEIRRADLTFTVEESRALVEAAGVRLSNGSLESLVRTTEGWAAGLRLAAFSLARHPDPEGFAAGFSGRERTVAEYLLAEVLERQPEPVSRLLLWTSMLDRVSGRLADHLLGGSGCERILAELEQAGAFVVAVDPERTWFRYHRLFADLLALELRRTAPDELPRLHTAAAEWFAEHGHPVDAIRHAQAAGNWELAVRLLADHWLAIYLDGRTATSNDLLSRFPADMVAKDPEFAVLAAINTRRFGSLDDLERYLALAARDASSVPQERQGRFQVALSLARLSLARARNDVDGVAEEARRLLAQAEEWEVFQLGLGEDLRVLALNAMGIAEVWTGRLEDAELHLDRGLAEARRIGRPLLELQALGHRALVDGIRSRPLAEQRAWQAIELARKHGWEERSLAAGAYLVLGTTHLRRGRLEEAEPWLERAERAGQRERDPAAALTLYVARGVLESARGRHHEAMSAFRIAERMDAELVTPHMVAVRARASRLKTLVQLGETDRVQSAFAVMAAEEREMGEMRVVVAALSLAENDPEAAGVVLEPVLDGSSRIDDPLWEIQAFLFEALVRDALRDAGAVSRALERALELAERERLLLPFLLVPAAELLERHVRLHGTHAALISEILALLAGRTPARQLDDAAPLLEALSDSELRVLRYLPTSLQGPEIAAELFVSVNTIRTHMRHLYAKLGVHRRMDAVERARELGLLTTSLRKH
jgi:LuxR family transcriptional regulator, maltose regulon positive regulatory protein